MTNISKIADQIGTHICQQAGLESELNKICFGIEVIMVMSVSIITMLTLGETLGFFRETVIVTIAAFLMKFTIGGPHLSGFLRCLIYSTILILTGSWICNLHQLWLNIPVTLLLFGLDLSILIGVKLAPSYRTFNQKQIITRKTLAILLIICSLIVYFPYFNIWGAGALIGFSISILNISPVGTTFVKWLDLITKRGGAVQ